MKNYNSLIVIIFLFQNAICVAQNALPCNINLYCSSFAPQGIYDNSARSVVQIIIENSAKCSATLIRQAIGNDNEQGNYLLTAKHCIRDGNLGLGDMLDLSTTKIYFNYSNSDCNFVDNVSNPDKKGRYKLPVEGVAFVAEDGLSDMALLKINGEIPPHFKPYYAGWSATPFQASVSGEFYDIHHARSEVKKISRANFLTVNSIGIYPARFEVAWLDGVTQNGSSGSGLINFNQRVIGTFSGGVVNGVYSSIFNDIDCLTNTFGNFGQLSYFWLMHNSVRNVLNPDNTFGTIGTAGGEIECYSGDLNLQGTYWPAKDYQPNNQIEINCANNIFASQSSATGENLTIKSEADFTFVAGNSIVLKPGFSTENGASFVAKIQPCSAQRPVNRDDILPEDEYLALLNSVNSSTNATKISDNSVTNETNRISPNSTHLNLQFQKITIYPNPNKGEFVLELSNAPKGNYTLQITDAVGRSVIQQNYTVQEQNLKQNINLQAHGKGIYFIKINSEQINEVRKVVVE